MESVAMRNRVLGTSLVISALLGAGSAITGYADEEPQLGALPELEIDQAKALLGKRLFFDPRLSGDAAISCATCHTPEHGFSSNRGLSEGYPGNGHFRNVPTMINTVHKTTWFHDGRIGTSLNDVTREMITEDYIMNMDMRLMQERLKQDPVYVQMFEDAGYGEPSNGSVRKAIPEYLNTLTSRGSPFDLGTLSDSAQRGLALFRGKARCESCHNGPLLSDGLAHNTGVPENLDIFRDPLNHQAFIAFNMFMGNGHFMTLKRDVGAAVQSHKADKTDVGTFMTPTLRELKYTAPYMHNGMLATLENVVAFYNNGGGQDRNKDTDLQPLHLTAGQQSDLVSFLTELSGEPLTTDEHVWTEAYPDEYDVIDDWRNVTN